MRSNNASIPPSVDSRSPLWIKVLDRWIEQCASAHRWPDVLLALYVWLLAARVGTRSAPGSRRVEFRYSPFIKWAGLRVGRRLLTPTEKQVRAALGRFAGEGWIRLPSGATRRRQGLTQQCITIEVLPIVKVEQNDGDSRAESRGDGADKATADDPGAQPTEAQRVAAGQPQRGDTGGDDRQRGDGGVEGIDSSELQKSISTSARSARERAWGDGKQAGRAAFTQAHREVFGDRPMVPDAEVGRIAAVYASLVVPKEHDGHGRSAADARRALTGFLAVVKMCASIPISAHHLKLRLASLLQRGGDDGVSAILDRVDQGASS